MTNQSLIGQTTDDIADQVILKVEFYDYLNNPITPSENVILNNSRGTEYEVTDTPSDHPFGSRTGGSIHSNWVIENNSMYVVGIRETAPREITAVNYFSFVSLTTSEKSYTKFKYTS